jgi:hypothetical protein
MTSQAHLVHPRHIGTWLVNLFTSAEGGETIAGDLLEEFSELASKCGVAFARRWYWRQITKTIAHLASAGFRAAPWSTTAAAVGGFFLLRFVFSLPERAIFAVLERYRVFDHHFNAYLFFASTGIDIGNVITSMLVGCTVAIVAKKREMIATTLLGLTLGVLCGVAIFASIGWGRSFLIWTLPWQFADWVAIVVGGATVRTLRSAATTWPSKAHDLRE